jgi:hypothetical protein
LVTHTRDDARFELATLGGALALSDVYAGVDFAEGTR